MNSFKQWVVGPSFLKIMVLLQGIAIIMVGLASINTSNSVRELRQEVRQLSK